MRDTDLDWTTIASTDPYFGVLSEEQFRGKHLDPAARETFYARGVEDIDYILLRARASVGLPEPIERALDFGSGTGRLSFAMAAHAGQVVGVDVAPGMRAEATAQAKQRGVGNVRFVPELPTEPVDWVNSFIVMQHIPPARGIELLQGMVDLLRPGGLLTVQLTFFKDARHVAELLRDLGDFSFDGTSARTLGGVETTEAGAMTMYDYDLNTVFRLLFRNGLTGAWTEHLDHGGCHGMRIFARRVA